MTNTFKSQAARDAANGDYGDDGYAQYIEDSAIAYYEYYLAQGNLSMANLMLSRSLGQALSGNDGE